MPCFGFSQNFRLKLTFIDRRNHTDARVAIHIHETQSTKPVEPGVSDLLNHLILAGLTDLFLQVGYCRRIFAARGTVVSQGKAQLG